MEKNDNWGDDFDLSGLEEVPDVEVKGRTSPAVVTVVPSTPKMAEPKPVVSEVTPVASDDEKAPDGLQEISFGTRVSNVPIARFKGVKDFKSRIAVLTSKIVAVKVHYVQGIGSFLCFDGACCELEGLPKLKYLIPVVQYNTDKSGKITDDKAELKVLSLGADGYGALSDAISMSGRAINDVDIVVSCSDDGFQKLTFAVDASVPCSWKKFSCAKSIVEYYKTHRSKMYMAVGRSISEETYLVKKGVAKTSDPVGNNAPVPTVQNLLD